MPARLCCLRNVKLIPVTRFLPALCYFLQYRPLRRNRKSPARPVVQQQITDLIATLTQQVHDLIG